MKQIRLGNSSLHVSAVALGAMRITHLSHEEAVNLLDTAYDAGINFFDNADIYAAGEAEKAFGAALKDASFAREDVIVQSKVGIQPQERYNMSKQHILESVDGALERLDLDYLDVVLLHRPDALMEPEEVAAAFDDLQSSGKVRRFGVSNFSPLQIDWLKKAVRQPIVANQLQLSLLHTGMIDEGIHVNMTDDRAIDRDGGLLPYSQLHDISIQAWSPFQSPHDGVYVDNPKFPQLNAKLQALADHYGVDKNAIVAAWILRIPGNNQIIAGTTNADRIRGIAAGGDVHLTGQEWYDLYTAAGNDLP